MSLITITGDYCSYIHLREHLPDVGQPVLPCFGVEMRDDFQLSILHSLGGTDKMFSKMNDEMKCLDNWSMFTGWPHIVTWNVSSTSHSHQPTCTAFLAIVSQRTNHCFFRRGSMISPERLRKEGGHKDIQKRETTNIIVQPLFSHVSKMKEIKKCIMILRQVLLRLHVCELYTDGLCTKPHSKQVWNITWADGQGWQPVFAFMPEL